MSFDVTYQNPKKFTVGVSENVFTATYSNPKKFTADIYSYIPDPPILLSAVVDGAISQAKVILTYDRDLDPASVPTNTDFSVTFSGGATTVNLPITIVGPIVYVTVSRLILYGETGTINYTAGTNPIMSLDADLAANLVSQVVTVSVAPVTKPVLQSIRVDNVARSTIKLTYDKEIEDYGSVSIDSSQFVLNLSGGAAIIILIPINPSNKKEVHIIINRNMTAGETGTVSYTAGLGYVIKSDLGGLLADDFVNEPIINNIV